MTGTPQRANRPHYHVWIKADGDRAFFKRARGFHTRQAAQQYVVRQEPDPGRRLVLKCHDYRCRPKL